MLNRVKQVNAEMPTLNQAAYVGASQGMRKAKRLDGDERIIRPRARGRRNAYEIVSSASNKRCRHRIKSRCIKTRTTIENRSRELADNWENNNALLRKLRAKSNVKPFSGGNLILQEIGYTDASTINANSYSGLIH